MPFDLHCACPQKIPLLCICFQFSFGWLSLSPCSYAESSGLHWIAFEGELADSVAPQLLSDPLAHDSRRGALKLNLHYPHLTSLIFIALTPVTATGATARILNPARLHSPQIKSSPCQLWCLDIESKLSATPPQRNSLFKAQTLATFQTPLCSPIELQPIRLLKERALLHQNIF